MAIFGYDLYEKYPEVIEIARYRNSFRNSRNFAQLFVLYDAIYKIGKYLEEMTEVCARVNAQFSQERLNLLKTSSDIWDLVEKGVQEISIVGYHHMTASHNSMIYQMLIFSFLTSSSDKLTLEHQADISLILSSMNDVESANVPVMVNQIAASIAYSKKREQFLEVENQLAVAWLKSNCSSAYELFESFLKRHGHRSINELDLMATSWSMDPELVITMIKTNLIASAATGGINTSSEASNPDKIVESLKTRLGSISKFFIQKLLPRAQNGVRNREIAKSRLVAVVNEVRRAVIHLAKVMVNEGILPDKDLIFHLSMNEIKAVIVSSDFKLIAKAVRRQKLFPKACELKFPDVTFGIPAPLIWNSSDKSNEATGDVLVTGIPVCGGVVKARACVCKSFADVDKLQKGDILITYGRLISARLPRILSDVFQAPTLDGALFSQF